MTSPCFSFYLLSWPTPLVPVKKLNKGRPVVEREPSFVFLLFSSKGWRCTIFHEQNKTLYPGVSGCPLRQSLSTLLEILKDSKGEEIKDSKNLNSSLHSALQHFSPYYLIWSPLYCSSRPLVNRWTFQQSSEGSAVWAWQKAWGHLKIAYQVTQKGL